MLIELPKAEHEYEIIDIERFNFSVNKLDREVVTRYNQEYTRINML